MSGARRPLRAAITRRQAMAALGAVTLKASAAPAAAAAKRVIVIGAGLSGLAAARDLAARGHDVIVLESRSRIGGRIWTSHNWPGMPMDLGASWIHGVSGNPLTALADESGAKRLATSYDAATSYDLNGQEVDLSVSMERAEAILLKARDAIEDNETDMSLADAVQASKEWMSADSKARRLLRHHINASIEQEYGGDWSEASAWHVDSGKEFDGGDQLFPQGFGQITSHLAKELDVRLGQKVVSLAPAPKGVHVKLADGTALLADHAVVTVPLGVLKADSIRFEDELSAPRQAAIQALRMGLLNKCWLRFERVAWPTDIDWMEWLGPNDGYWAQWVSLAKAASLPVLLAFHAGSQARDMERLSDRDMQAAAHDALKAMLGTGFPAPVAAQVTRWSADDNCHGSYSFNAVAVTPETRRALAGKDWGGRLVFAGEATSADYFGTAHGAFFSGKAAARSIP